MLITKNNEYHEWAGTQEEFESSSLPGKGWAVYVGVWPIVNIVSFPELKEQKKLQISIGFDSTLNSKNTVYQTHNLLTNISINARERDLNNLEQLEKYMIDNNISDTNFRCFDNTFANLSLADVTAITKELRGFGLYLYQQKWLLEAQIDSIIEDTEANRSIINTIDWNF